MLPLLWHFRLEILRAVSTPSSLGEGERGRLGDWEIGKSPKYKLIHQFSNARQSDIYEMGSEFQSKIQNQSYYFDSPIGNPPDIKDIIRSIAKIAIAETTTAAVADSPTCLTPP
jgi:hypothetical protein